MVRSRFGTSCLPSTKSFQLHKLRSVTNIKVIPDMYGKWFPYSELTTSICLKYNIAHDVWDCKYIFYEDI
ncbi:hypothetical protein K439DRAFT_1638656 [Ramaria rubella]|nr:hypothetical protein K439DRAFT_1638656 [Ramaria rubella]